MARKLSKKLKRLIIISVIVFASLAAALIIWHEPLFNFFTNKEYVKNLVESAGIFGPLIFILLQTLQIVLAPIPGQAVGVIGGYLFGVFWGTVLSLIGSLIGFIIVFFIARKFGRPLVERIFNKDLIKKFDHVTNNTNIFLILIIFLLPVSPDAVYYLAGLSPIPVPTLILIALVARIPGVLVASLVGAGLGAGSVRPIISIAVAIILLATLIYLKRQWFFGLVKTNNHVKYIRNTWPFRRTKTILILISLAAAIALLVLFAFF